jgi:hypothetical protein
MNKKLNNLVLLLVSCIFMLGVPLVVHAQVSGIGGVRMAGSGDPAKPIVDYNLEPVMTLDLKQEVIEILPGGVNILSVAPYSKYGVEWRVGSNGLHGFSLGPNRDTTVWIQTHLLQLDNNGILLDLSITDGKTKAILAAQKLPLQNYQEAIIEFATAVTGDRRLAVRFLPTVKIKEPLQGYPGVIGSFGFRGPGTYLILNGKEVFARGGGSVGLDSGDEGKQQFCTIYGPTGLLVVSYRPFPGAVIKGYFQDRRLIFDWNGDVYEWISPGNSILPEGKWAAYVWQASVTPFDKPGTTIFADSPDQLRSRIEQMIERIKGQK